MLRSVARKSAYAITGTTILSGTSLAAYTSTEQGKGLKRQIQFWSNLAPIVASYYIYTASSSPYVKLEKALFYNGNNDGGKEEYTKKRNELLQQLHEKNAPELLNILQSLRGLYIKLGQVLSVSALPIPQIYKKELRVLQSDVPGHEEFESIIKPIIEKELDQPIEDVFDVIEPVPCGAASIGQAHKAKLKQGQKYEEDKTENKNDESENNNDFDVVIKVQYPHASWQVPADIKCIGQFLKMCIYFDIVDETSAQLSYDEFSRQFLSELDYTTETENLKLIYESSLDKNNAPYHRRNVIVPKVFENLCSNKVITMEYIPGPKIEEEARKQLELLGIKTDRSIKDIVKDAGKEIDRIEGREERVKEFDEDKIQISEEALDDVSHDNNTAVVNDSSSQIESKKEKKQPYEKQGRNQAKLSLSGDGNSSWKAKALNTIGKALGIDNIFWIMRTFRRLFFLSQASTVKLIQVSPRFIIPTSLNNWAANHEAAAANASTLNLTKEWIDALFDVHGHQIFHLGCFNADCHPGNILVVEDKENGRPTETLGLIDFGQCKRLTAEEQHSIATLILSVANNDTDDVIANNFRKMGIKTQKDSTQFIAAFSKLMFGPLQPEHMEHRWHLELHKMDKVLYFPKELSMVYRTSLLLRGLALSLQINCSISEQWKSHAKAVVDKAGN